MRVIHVVRQYAPCVGGLESYVAALTREQAALGVDARIVTLDRDLATGAALPPSERRGAVPVTRLRFFGSRRYPVAPGIMAAIAGADLVHVHGVDFFCDALAAMRRWHRTPLVLTTHGGYFHTRAHFRLKRLMFATVTPASLAAYARVYASSAADAARFAPILRAPPVLLPQAVDTAKFHGAGAAEATHGIAAIGRFAVNKRLDLLLASFAALAAGEPRARLHIIGRDWDGMLSTLQRAIAERGLGERAFVHVGLDDAGVRAVLGQCTYIASASDYEGFGLAVVEGLAAGLVPLVSDIPSFRAIVAQAGIGHIVDFRHADAAAAAIAGIMAEHAPRHARRRAAAMDAAAAYDFAVSARAHIEDYAAVLRASRTRPARLQGVAFAGHSRAAAVAALDAARLRGTPLSIAFGNANTLNIAAADGTFRQMLARFLVLNDGVGVDIASRLKFGHAFADNLNGTDFLPHYLAVTKLPARIFLIGGEAHVALRAAAYLTAAFPRHRIVGVEHGFRTTAEMPGIEALVRAARADIVLVAMGSPRQEQWIAAHGAATGALLLFGVGALFDFLSAARPRAPRWVRRARLEWAFRLGQEPQRLWRRYLLGNATFLARALGDMRRRTQAKGR